MERPVSDSTLGPFDRERPADQGTTPPSLPATSAARPGRAMALAAAVLLFVAAAGVAGGVALDRLVLAPHAAFARGRPPFGGGAGMRGLGGPGGDPRRMDPEMRKRFQREYGITDEQQKRIDVILDRQAPRIDSLRAEIRPRMQTLIEETRRQIDSVLTPAQRERVHAEERERERRRRPPPGIPAEPPDRPGPRP
jgi:hypothetical protein